MIAGRSVRSVRTTRLYTHIIEAGGRSYLRIVAGRPESGRAGWEGADGKGKEGTPRRTPPPEGVWPGRLRPAAGRLSRSVAPGPSRRSDPALRPSRRNRRHAIPRFFIPPRRGFGPSPGRTPVVRRPERSAVGVGRIDTRPVGRPLRWRRLAGRLWGVAPIAPRHRAYRGDR
jgi:hypothetical protein